MTLLIKELEEGVRSCLEKRAKLHGWSIEEEVKAILSEAAGAETNGEGGLGTRIHSRFAKEGLDDRIEEMRGHGIKTLDLD